jgi:hypothetical protein
MKIKVPRGGRVYKYPAGTATDRTSYWIVDREGFLVGVTEEPEEETHDTETEEKS